MDEVPDEILEVFKESRELLKDRVINHFLNKTTFFKNNLGNPGKVLFYDGIFRKRHIVKLKRIYDLSCWIDCYLSLAWKSYEQKLVFPEICEEWSTEIQISGVYHLLVKNAVPNDYYSKMNTPLLLLTGPNMAGKTTFMKACAVAIFLAHLGLPVPAHKMKIPLIDRIAASISISENLQSGHSFFKAEVERIKRISTWLAEGDHCFILLDEPFKGTNNSDSNDGNRVLIFLLSCHPTIRGILSSHLIELAAELLDNNQSGVQFQCFNASILDKEFQYSYQLQKGISDQHLGMKIIEEAGIPQLLKI